MRQGRATGDMDLIRMVGKECRGGRDGKGNKLGKGYLDATNFARWLYLQYSIDGTVHGWKNKDHPLLE